MTEVLWEPTGKPTNIARYLDHLGRFGSYEELWRWSVEDLEGFWASLWDFFGIGSSYETVVRGQMPAAEWFPGATLNYAERALAGDGPAVVARSQTRGPIDLTFEELRDQVARCRAGLQRLGVGEGDRVVAYLPNAPEALVAFLASASLGAIWASCPPEFGVRSVIDRFGQLDPTVLLAVGGYRYGTKDIDRSAEVTAIREALPTLTAVVEVPYFGDPLPDAVGWDHLLGEPAELAFQSVPFDHPLYVLFSSGTTGLPKAIVHGHGGILLEHLKSLVLHHDLGPGDRFFWFSTTGWMMWNLLVSGLCAGAAVVLFDGDPGHPDLGALWDLARETETTVFGVSAPFLMNCRKAGVDVGDQPTIRSVGSTGAPLPAEGFRWVYEQLPDVWLTSVSGGTDVCTAFVGGSPLVPVYAGEISCRYLGAAVEAFDQDGRSLIGEQGELVVTKPMPSMPVGFWGDPDGGAYRAAYFERFPGVWCHGDWITITERGTCTITGRSDATLNRGGVRLGTSEFYSVVESFAEVADSLVVDIDGRLLLFVQLARGAELDDDLRRRIAGELRTHLSPRHVPDEVHAVRAIPRTHSGKKLEIPVKRILTGVPAAEVVSPGALADPGAIEDFEAIARSG
ncbi:MAG: acetoacetyl-CoA synthase [Acidimicrobiales bacterium]|nr:acetoacetyl-CoA synthase [Acidimicrobiales bacterium]